MDYKNMTDEELWALIRKRYGEDWKPQDLLEDEALAREFSNRISWGQ
jgi:hypothetical protein